MPAEDKRTAGAEINARFSLLLPYKAFELSFPIYRCLANKLTIQGNNIGAPDVRQPSPSSEIQGWGCSNERATGTACGSYPRAKQSKEREREREETHHTSPPSKARKRGALLAPYAWEKKRERERQRESVAG